MKKSETSSYSFDWWLVSISLHQHTWEDAGHRVSHLSGSFDPMLDALKEVSASCVLYWLKVVVVVLSSLHTFSCSYRSLTQPFTINPLSLFAFPQPSLHIWVVLHMWTFPLIFWKTFNPTVGHRMFSVPDIKTCDVDQLLEYPRPAEQEGG